MWYSLKGKNRRKIPYERTGEVSRTTLYKKLGTAISLGGIAFLF
jgi:hypothetical protein